MSIVVGSTVSATTYNQLVADISSLVVGEYGYISTTTVRPVITGTQILLGDWFNLYQELTRVHIHQYNSLLPNVQAPQRGQVLTYNLVHALSTQTQALTASKYTVHPAQLTSSTITDTRVGLWNTNINSNLVYTWSSTTDVSTYLNLGGRIAVDISFPNQDYSANPDDVEWANLLTNLKNQLVANGNYFDRTHGSSRIISVASNSNFAAVNWSRVDNVITVLVDLNYGALTSIGVLPTVKYINYSSSGQSGPDPYGIPAAGYLPNGNSFNLAPIAVSNTRVIRVDNPDGSILDYSYNAFDNSVSKTLTFTNVGNAAVNITGIEFTNPTFITVSRTGTLTVPSTIAPGQSRTMVLSFSANQVKIGLYNFQLRIFSNNDQGTIVVPIRNQIGVPAYNIEAVPGSWNTSTTTTNVISQFFGLVPSSGTRIDNYTVALSNNPGTSLSVSSVSPFGPRVTFNPNRVSNGTYLSTLTVTASYSAFNTTFFTEVDVEMVINRNVVAYNLGSWKSAGSAANSVVGMSYDVIAGTRYLTIGFGSGADNSPVVGGSNVDIIYRAVTSINSDFPQARPDLTGYFVRSAGQGLFDQTSGELVFIREWWVFINGSLVYNSTTSAPTDYVALGAVTQAEIYNDSWPGGVDWITAFNFKLSGSLIPDLGGYTYVTVENLGITADDNYLAGPALYKTPSRSGYTSFLNNYGVWISSVEGTPNNVIQIKRYSFYVDVAGSYYWRYAVDSNGYVKISDTVLVDNRYNSQGQVSQDSYSSSEYNGFLTLEVGTYVLEFAVTNFAPSLGSFGFSIGLQTAPYTEVWSTLVPVRQTLPYRHWAEVFRIPLNKGDNIYLSSFYTVKDTGADRGKLFSVSFGSGSLCGIHDVNGTGNLDISFYSQLRNAIIDNLNFAPVDTHYATLYAPWYYAQAIDSRRIYQLEPSGHNTALSGSYKYVGSRAPGMLYYQTRFFLGFDSLGNVRTSVSTYPGFYEIQGIPLLAEPIVYNIETGGTGGGDFVSPSPEPGPAPGYGDFHEQGNPAAPGPAAPSLNNAFDIAMLGNAGLSVAPDTSPGRGFSGPELSVAPGTSGPEPGQAAPESTSLTGVPGNVAQSFAVSDLSLGIVAGPGYGVSGPAPGQAAPDAVSLNGVSSTSDTGSPGNATGAGTTGGSTDSAGNQGLGGSEAGGAGDAGSGAGTSGAAGNDCFAKGTNILMADGEFKAIEFIEIGDLVMAFNGKINKFVNGKVKNKFRHLNSKFGIIDGIGVTPNHPFATLSGYKPIVDLTDNDEIINGQGLKIRCPKFVIHDLQDNTYNIEITEHHTYVVKGNTDSYLVHNKDSFISGTKILMADGNIKNIEEIEIGEYIMAYDDKLNAQVPGKVLKTFYKEDCEIISLDGIGVSPRHKFKTTSGYEQIGLVSKDQGLINGFGNKVNKPEHTNFTDIRACIYDLMVEKYHNYIVVGQNNSYIVSQ